MAFFSSFPLVLAGLAEMDPNFAIFPGNWEISAELCRSKLLAGDGEAGAPDDGFWAIEH